MTGKTLKADNGSGYSLKADSHISHRRLHDDVVYLVSYRGAACDASTICGVERARKGWDTKHTA